MNQSFSDRSINIEVSRNNVKDQTTLQTFTLKIKNETGIEIFNDFDKVEHRTSGDEQSKYKNSKERRKNKIHGVMKFTINREIDSSKSDIDERYGGNSIKTRNRNRKAEFLTALVITLTERLYNKEASSVKAAVCVTEREVERTKKRLLPVN